MPFETIARAFWVPRVPLARLLFREVPAKNPLASGRVAILSYDSLLSKACAEGDLDEVKRLLVELRTHLVKHNSNVSMKLVKGIHALGQPKATAEVKALFLEHNAKYRSVRDLINGLLLNPNDIDLETTDDTSLVDRFATLTNGHNTYLFGSLLNLRINISYIEETWEKMAKYEQLLFGAEQ